MIDWLEQVLLRPEIWLRGLHRGMAERELDVFRIPASVPAELGAGAAEAVGATSPSSVFPQ
jgi:hypothetical protein